MTLRIDRTRIRSIRRCAALAGATASLVLPAGAAAQAAARASARPPLASATGRGAGTGSPASPYPAGAARPSIRVPAAALRRPAASGTGTASSARSSAAAAARARKTPSKPALHGNPARALVAFQEMQKQYYIHGSGLYDGEPFSYLWPFSQAFAATVTLANVPSLAHTMARELQVRVIGLHDYLDTDNAGDAEGAYTSTLPAFDGTVAPPAGPGGPKYYDDNDWVGIELVRLYKLNHSAVALGSAEGIMAFEMAGWQETPGLACPGGIPFNNSSTNTERNTVTTAPAAELAVQLYRLTSNPQYLQFAEKAYEWVRTCLLGANGLYADHIGPKGVVEPMLWSYNQGSMIGAGTLLYQTTGNSAYLYQARQTAKAALAYFTPERLGAEIPFFAAVYFRNLLYLDSVTHDPPGPKIAQAYVNYAWQYLRLSNNLFVAGSPSSAQLLVQSAIVQIYGLLASPPSTYF